jgi:hypothetical protein
MPRTRIAVGFCSVTYLWAFIARQRARETDFAIPAFELVDIIFIIRVFDIKFLTAANWAFGIGHRYSPSCEIIRRHLAAIFAIAAGIEQVQHHFNIGFHQCCIELVGLRNLWRRNILLAHIGPSSPKTNLVHILI